jgi:hypothetical protein
MIGERINQHRFSLQKIYRSVLKKFASKATIGGGIADKFIQCKIHPGLWTEWIPMPCFCLAAFCLFCQHCLHHF